MTQIETRVFHYDLRGHLIAETNQSGQILAEYIYLGDQLLATIQGEQAYYYQNDHLGTPQVLTNDSGSIVWKASYTPFGKAQISIESVENPFRFPGQYYDQETGLHYNYFRYYNPQTGRYIAPDPIGLEGGTNLFLYVRGNPLKWVDPWGLYECTYYISQHRMVCTPNAIPHAPLDSTNFVAGNNNVMGPLQCECQNNPEATGWPYHGPLPVGDYTIGPQRPGSSRRDLTRYILNEMFSRGYFQVHGCKDPSSCSEGCIAATTNATRDRFNLLMSLEEGNNILHVQP